MGKGGKQCNEGTTATFSKIKKKKGRKENKQSERVHAQPSSLHVDLFYATDFRLTKKSNTKQKLAAIAAAGRLKEVKNSSLEKKGANIAPVLSVTVWVTRRSLLGGVYRSARFPLLRCAMKHSS